jgi:hypothetical protein
MSTLTFAIATAALLIPAERHIDFSGWPGAATVQFDVRVTAMDGTVYKTSVELFPGSDAEDARGLLWAGLKNAGYRGHTVGKGILVLEASKKSPIRSVEFTSKGWKPDVRAVLKVPEKK